MLSRRQKTLAGYGKPLMIALFVIIGFSLVNLFLGSPLLSIIISAAVVLLFSVLVVYDTQNIIRGAYETPIDGAIALYLDFLNIFTVTSSPSWYFWRRRLIYPLRRDR